MNGISKTAAAIWIPSCLFCVACGEGADRTADASNSEIKTPFERVAEREAMVKRQLAARDIRDKRVLDAMRRVPRHLFIPENRRQLAYNDHPVPIGLRQTISQPYIVAYMTQALKLQAEDSVLEIGTGSGYQAAVLGELVREVYSIEIIPELGERSKKLLAKLDYGNIQVRIGDGYKGWPDQAPFDAIIVTAAVRLSSSQPSRILAVTGMSTASTMARMRFCVLPRSDIMEAFLSATLNDRS